MANLVKGEVPLKLKDGREFTLVADIEATIEAESLYGKPAAELARDAERGFIGAIRALLWGMMRAHHRAISPGEVSQLIQENMEEIEKALTAAAQAAAPKPVDSEGGDDEDPPSQPVGKKSGASGAKRG